jgi:hypothetical protein
MTAASSTSDCGAGLRYFCCERRCHRSHGCAPWALGRRSPASRAGLEGVFGWQLSLPRKQRRQARAVFEGPPPGLGQMFGLGGMDDAPPEAASRYRHHAGRFITEGVFCIAIAFVIVYLPS